MNLKLEIRHLELRLKISAIGLRSDNKDYVLSEKATELIRIISTRGFKKGIVPIYKSEYRFKQVNDLLTELKKHDFVKIKNLNLQRGSQSTTGIQKKFHEKEDIREFSFTAHIGDAGSFYIYLGDQTTSTKSTRSKKWIKYEWKVKPPFKAYSK